MNRLPVGAAPTLLVIALVLTGTWLLVVSLPQQDDKAEDYPTNLRVWTFARNHYDAYCEALPSFESAHPGVKVKIELVHYRAVSERLQAAFWGDLDVPDLVEVEIGYAGSFFRGPLEDVGFLDLTDKIHSSGLYDRVVRARFAPYTSRGRIFGLPHDVHPVMIAYRRDLFEQEGINAAELDTWDKFIEAGRRVTRDLTGDGTIDRYMIELADMSTQSLEVMLFQRGGGFFDAEGRLIIDDEVSLETLCWFVPLVVGPGRIASSLGEGQIRTQAVDSGYLLSLICPDWRTSVFEMDMPRLAGKMALMPLPAPEPGGRRTSTWGGTMIGITRKSRNPDLAWELALHLYYNTTYLGDRFRSSNIIPPLRDAWQLPAFSEPRPYWSGQRIGELFVSLADQTPPQYTSPFITMARSKLGEALVESVKYYGREGERGFTEYARSVLKSKADEVRAVMKRDGFE